MFTTIDHPEGLLGSELTGINNHGDIVGWYLDANQGHHVFLRGNPNNPGALAPPHFLSCLGGSDEKPFRDGSGRLELARGIIDPENPLTARVIVNRVWMHHFGFGLVRTPSDFGFRGDPPTHPELLDYLAVRFMESGWSLKNLHRLIMEDRNRLVQAN